ncbi:MAG: YbaB/EbfC family nucleoid-associated protein [Candidatus Gastranaerophilales bacterium]|nr:YbaB/EbfC family nucleoid-associated protein [Candidatus Gastranaerophilales bacterium]
MNLANMMKQAQQVQKRLQDAQKDLAETDITAQSSNGAVTVVCDGHGKFKSIKLTKEAINAENPNSVDDETVEILEDLITSAMKQATSDAEKKMQDKMKGIVPAGINIPGLF